MGRKLKAIISIGALAALYGAYYWGIPALINKPYFENFIETQIKKSSGFRVDLINPKFKMGLLPSMWLKADQIAVINDDSSIPLKLEQPALKLQIIPLILKNAEISVFNADNSFVELTCDKKGNIKLGQYPVKFDSKSKFTLNKIKINLNKYKIIFNDEIQGKKILLDGKYFNLEDFEKDKRAKFSTESNFIVDGKPSSIKADLDLKLPLNSINEDQFLINADIKNLDLSIFKIYVRAVSKNNYNDLKGILNFNAVTEITKDKHKNITTKLTLDNFGFMKKDLAGSTYCNGRFEVNSTVNTIKNGIHIANLTLKAPKVDLAVNGNVTKLNQKFPYLDLQTTINKSRSENIITLLPGEENLLPDFNFYLLKKHVFYSDVIGHINVKGIANNPELFGNVLITDGYLSERIPNTSKGATVKLSMDKQIMHLDANVQTDPSEEVNVTGDFKLFTNRRSDLHITSTQNINLSKVYKVIMPLHNIIKFEIGPVPLMTISGYGNIDLRVSGTKIEPHGWGEMNFKNANAAFNDIHNLTLKGINAKLTFDDRLAAFKTSKAALYGLPVTVEGTSSLSGDMDFTAATKNQKTENLLKVINTSPVLAELQEVAEPVKSIKGLADLNINLTGHMKPGIEPVFNENLFAKGSVDFHNNTAELKDIPTKFTKLSGRVNFVNQDADFDMVTYIENSKVQFKGTVKNENINATAYSNKFNAGDALRITSRMYPNIPYIKDSESINSAFTAYYQAKADKEIHYDKIIMKGKIYNNFGSGNPILVGNGEFNLKNNHLTVTPLKGMYRNNPYTLKVDVTNFLTDNFRINGNASMKNFNLEALNELGPLEEIFPQYKDKLKEFGRFSGKTNISVRITDNRLRVFSQLNDVSFIYLPKHLRIKIMNGHYLLNNDTLFLNKINAFAGRMPVFINGKVSDVYKNPDADLYINAKPTQEFFDQFFNNKAVYPIKLKGDVNCTAQVKGTQNKLGTKIDLKLDESSSLYYMGATIGDLVSPVTIYADTVVTPNSIKINNFRYDKIITSLNNKQNPNTQLTASGYVEKIDENNFKFKNLRVTTHNPTDAKIFNIIFKKPLMKQGVFTSDLLINGTTASPKILGQLDVTSIDMPFFDATIKDIHTNFKKDLVTLNSRGSVLNNNITLNAVIKNSFPDPIVFKDIKLHFIDLNLNKITGSLQDYDADIYKQQIATPSQIQPLNPSQIRIEKSEVTADNILLKSLSATNFKANVTMGSDSILNVTNYGFDMAQGSVKGTLKYNLNTNDFTINSHIADANAQIITESLFDLKGQLYGTTTGDITLSCNGKSQNLCLNTLSGRGEFKVAHGRMPKLGSLEYLLKAANLAKSGITGLSINSIIDIITPLKTGEFESISGSYEVKDGIAHDINVYSKGKDLNLFLTGSYNVTNSIADMEVYGTLSNNITNVLGRLKNASLNTLLNMIPLLNNNELSPELEAELRKIPNYETNNNIFRIFAVDIDGDINGINYVKSFKWVK